MLESTIEHYLINRVARLGGDTRKVRWIGRNGAPDRLVGIPGRKAIFVELKAPGEKPEPHQVREHARLRNIFGMQTLIIDSHAAVDRHFPLKETE